MNKEQIFSSVAKLACAVVVGICVWHMSASAAKTVIEREVASAPTPTPIVIEVTPMPTPVPATPEPTVAPTPEPTVEPTPQVKYEYVYIYSTPDYYLYTVQSGDTLGKIANIFKVNVHWLAAVNNLDNMDIIEVGQTIRIPKD